MSFLPHVEWKFIAIELPVTFLPFGCLYLGILGFESEQYFCPLDFCIFNLRRPAWFVCLVYSLRSNIFFRVLFSYLTHSCHNFPAKNFFWPTARGKSSFFTKNSLRNICKFIFAWKVKKMSFSGYFFLWDKHKSQITMSHRTHASRKYPFKTLASKRNISFELTNTIHRHALNLFRINLATSC